MSNNPQNQLFSPIVTVPPPTAARRIATRVADTVRTVLAVLFWLILLAAGLAVAFLAVLTLVVGVGIARRALGL
ncbi:MAG: hypothetical protein NTU53_02530 [Planctomycetota bacterium]|nr:hypothetical protein [Planctomycetota bacterium]